MPFIEKVTNAVKEAIESALGVSFLDMFIQIVATIILVLVVKYFFWGRITEYLDKRKAIMDQNYKEAKEANEEAAKLKEKTHKDYQDLKSKSRDYLENARKKGDEEKQLIIQKAKKEANNLIEQTNREIEVEKARAKAEIQKEVIDLATLMASKIIKEEIDKDKYEDIAVEDVERSEKV